MEERTDKGTDQKEKRKGDVEIGGRIASGEQCNIDKPLVKIAILSVLFFAKLCDFFIERTVIASVVMQISDFVWQAGCDHVLPSCLLRESGLRNRAINLVIH